MRISLKILLVMLLVAVIPVAVSGFTAVVLAKRAVAAAASDKLEAEARHLAEVAETTIIGSLEDLRQAATLGLHELSNDEVAGALWIIYRGDDARAAVALIDGETGEAVVAPVYQETVSDEPGLAGHEPFPATAVDAFAQHVPLADALATGKAVSVPYVDAARGAPLIALAVRVPGRKDAAGHERPWVVAVELSLRGLNQRFEEAADERFRAALVDLEGRAVCHTARDVALARAPVLPEAAARLADPRASSSGALDARGEPTLLVAYARASRLAAPDGKTWGVVVDRDRAQALADVRALERRTLFWVGTALLLALIAGTVLARGVARPVERLTAIVRRFSEGGQRGGLDVRAPDLGTDEIGVLAGAFNKMADDIDGYTGQLRSFNEELQKKVDDRTRELKEAQGQLIQSQKMAAVGELGAGVAHEINNPLAGVLGSAQLALLRADKSDTRVRTHLQDIEREALRIKDIVDSLLKLSQDQAGQSAGTVDVNQVVDGAMALLARPIIAQRISVKKELGNGLPKVRGKMAELQQAVMQLLTNAKDAMPEGGTLTVRTEAVDGRLVKIVVDDTGHGIPEAMKERIFEPFFTTRASKGNKGMGLAIVHRIVEEHGGRVAVDSSPGKGASVRLTFPATRETLHLV
ncbi:MAG: HAMP domain-containing protein [Deltaproteobacteria bacterium]|nr:HAMP domain-containing protein [Deltaproteobacteria bacterium]